MYTNKFKKIYESNFQRYQAGGVLAGDLVKFVDNVLNSDWFDTQAPSVKERVQEMLDSDLNIRVSVVKGLRPAHDGDKQQDNHAGDYVCDICTELAPGLFTNVLTVPASVLEIIDTNWNLSPVPDSQKKEDPSHINPEEPDLQEGDDETCPMYGTHSLRGDRKLGTQDTAGFGKPGKDNMTTAVYMS